MGVRAGASTCVSAPRASTSILASCAVPSVGRSEEQKRCYPGFADYAQSTERTIPVMPSLVADLTHRGADQATMPCGSMTYFWAAPLSKSA